MADRSLAVRLHSLGDVVLASGTVSALAEEGKTFFATSPGFAPVAERFPGVASVITVTGWRELRRAAVGFSRVIDLQNNLTTGTALFGRATARYSLDRRKRRAILRGSGESMVWRAADYMEAAGLSGDPMPVLSRREYPEPGETTVGIVTGGRWPMKAIPDGVAAELARLFCDVLDARVFLIGGEQDRTRAEAVSEQCGYRRVVPVAGEGDIGQLVRRIEGLDLLVSPDSGPAHIGIGLGVPTQVIFTATSPALGFYPPDLPGIFMTCGVRCRPCHRHGGTSCRVGDELCRRSLVPRELFQEALCLMR